MGMSNNEIAALIAGADGDADGDDVNVPLENSESKDNGGKKKKKRKETQSNSDENQIPLEESGVPFISQEAMDSLLGGFVADDDDSNENLIDEIHEAILNSGKLSLMQWVKLRERLREIELLIPHIDLIIRLKSKNEDKQTNGR